MVFLCAMLALAQTVVIHVSPNGSDSNSGTSEAPLKTLDGARLAARQDNRRSTIVEFEAGTYRLASTVTFSAKDSGDVTYRAKPDALVTLCGSDGFKASWQKGEGNILRCQVPDSFNTDQLFINGERQVLARYPNEDLSVRILHGYAKDAISSERVARWKDPAGGYLHAMHSEMWGDFHYRILGKETSGKLEIEGGWQNNRKMGMHPKYRFVEGIFEELDAPGEWFLDNESHTLFFYPRPGMDFSNSYVEGPRLSTLIEMDGAKGIKFQGIHFTHTTRTFMDNREPLLRSDWTIYRGGAIHFKGSTACSLDDCVLDNLGGNAIFVDGRNRNLAFRRCEINDIGANAFAFVGSPNAVRSPLFEYGERQTYANLDKTIGPKTSDYPADCLVEDCLIHNVGTVEKQSAGVEIAMAERITLRHCSIYHTPRAGINIGDGCWGGNIIEGCDVFDTVLETGDHGSFNSWGRDRYWGLTDIDMTLGKRPELAELDAIKPNILRNNRWRCDHGWDIDLDDGSSNYIIQNNLCLNGGIKNREGYKRVVENNIMVANSFHPHVWFLNSGDVFSKNIVFTPYRPIQVPKPWGREVDHNFLHVARLNLTQPAIELAKNSGRDESSLKGDAGFVDPTHGDYTVRPGSPALKIGFKNFPMNDFGVRPPALKARAQQPVLVNVQIDLGSIDTGDWNGAEVKDLVDPGDVSATGLSERKGVLVTAIHLGSTAERMGLRPLDVILAVGNVKVTTVKVLLSLKPLPSNSIISIWRNQRMDSIKFRY